MPLDENKPTSLTDLLAKLTDSNKPKEVPVELDGIETQGLDDFEDLPSKNSEVIEEEVSGNVPFQEIEAQLFEVLEELVVDASEPEVRERFLLGKGIDPSPTSTPSNPPIETELIRGREFTSPEQNLPTLRNVSREMFNSEMISDLNLQESDLIVLRDMAKACESLVKLSERAVEISPDKIAVGVNAADKAVKGLKELHSRLEVCRDRKNLDTQVRIMAIIVVMLKGVLRELQLQADVRELIIQSLVLRFQTYQEDERKAANRR